MALDKIIIGTRIREIREGIFGETRKLFAQRCNLNERYIGQVERGEFLLSLNALNQIVSSTGMDINYILYGKGESKKLNIIENLHNIIDISDKDELKMYYKCICTIKSYVNKSINE